MRVSIIDDHPPTSRGLLAIITDRNGIASNHACKTVRQFLEFEAANGDSRTDVVLLDLDLKDGTTVSENIEQLLPLDYGIVVYTQEVRPGLLQAALAAGAHCLVSKGDSESTLAESLLAAHTRDPSFLSPLMSKIMRQSEHLVPVLTERQAEVLRWHAEGLTDREIGRVLGCSHTTVRAHIRNIKERYEALSRPAGTRSQLLKNGLADGFVPFDWYLEDGDGREG